MIFYLCDGKNPRCKDSENCGVNNIEGGCFHTADHVHAKNNPDVTPEELKERFDKEEGHYFERREPWMR